MINQQLLDFIKQQTALGKTKEEIKQALIQTGWQEADVEQGLAAFASGTPAPINPGKLSGAGELFKQAWNLYKKRFGVFFGIYLIAYLVITGLMLLLQAFNVIDNQSRVIMTSSTPFIWVLLIIVWLAVIYLGIWSEAALLFSIKDSGENIGISESYKRGSRKIGSLFIVGLLTFLAIMGGFILLIIPGIIFGVWFSQGNYIAVTENLSGTAALSQSKRYVQGKFWAVVWRFFYIAVITIIISIIVGILSGILHNEIAKVVLNGAFSVLWTPVAVVYGYLLYQNLKANS